VARRSVQHFRKIKWIFNSLPPESATAELPEFFNFPSSCWFRADCATLYRARAMTGKGARTPQGAVQSAAVGIG
jgi:hypothetical protein